MLCERVPLIASSSQTHVGMLAILELATSRIVEVDAYFPAVAIHCSRTSLLAAWTIELTRTLLFLVEVIEHGVHTHIRPGCAFLSLLAAV